METTVGGGGGALISVPLGILRSAIIEEMELGNDQKEQRTLNNPSLVCRNFNVPDDVCQNLRAMLIDLQADKNSRRRGRSARNKRDRHVENKMTGGAGWLMLSMTDLFSYLLPYPAFS